MSCKILYGSHSTTYTQQLLRRLTSMDESHKAQSMGVDVSGLPFRKESFISSQKSRIMLIIPVCYEDKEAAMDIVPY